MPRPFDPHRIPSVRELREQVKAYETWLQGKELDEEAIRLVNVLRQELGLIRDVEDTEGKRATRVGMDLGRLIGIIAYSGSLRIRFLKGLIYQLGREISRA